MANLCIIIPKRLAEKYPVWNNYVSGLIENESQPATITDGEGAVGLNLHEITDAETDEMKNIMPPEIQAFIDAQTKIINKREARMKAKKEAKKNNKK